MVTPSGVFTNSTLDIEDKHRLLIANTELNFIDGIGIEDDTSAEIHIPTWLVVRDKVAAQPIKGSKNIKVKNQGKATYRVIFGAGLLLQGNEIIPAVNRLAVFVERAINGVEYAFTLSQI
jgi:hypothetical protein